MSSHIIPPFETYGIERQFLDHDHDSQPVHAWADFDTLTDGKSGRYTYQLLPSHTRRNLDVVHFDSFPRVSYDSLLLSLNTKCTYLHYRHTATAGAFGSCSKFIRLPLCPTYVCLNIILGSGPRLAELLPLCVYTDDLRLRIHVLDLLYDVHTPLVRDCLHRNVSSFSPSHNIDLSFVVW